MSKKIFALIGALTLLSACSDGDLFDAGLGAAGVVIIDSIMEDQNGDDGLF